MAGEEGPSGGGVNQVLFQLPALGGTKESRKTRGGREREERVNAVQRILNQGELMQKERVNARKSW